MSTLALRAARNWGELRPFFISWIALVAAVILLDLALAVTYLSLPPDLAQLLHLSFPVQFKNWMMWTAFAPSMVLFARALVGRPWSWSRRVVFSIGITLALALAHAGVEMGLWEIARSAHGVHPRATAGTFFFYHLWHGLLTAWVIFTVAVMIEHDRSSRRRALLEAQLQDQATRAQLQTLRMQLQPHFLFNTLNSISALVEDDARTGQRMIGRLSEFLRLTLSQASHAEVSLREELMLLRSYIELEQMRFQERLQVEVEVEPEAEHALVPNLILQPLVENAIRHGIQPAIDGGTVTIRAGREGEWLVIEILDDGVGFRPGAEPARGSGIGLANTRQRLEQCFGRQQRFEISPRVPTGTRVTLHLPWKEAPVGVATA